MPESPQGPAGRRPGYGRSRRRAYARVAGLCAGLLVAGTALGGCISSDGADPDWKKSKSGQSPPPKPVWDRSPASIAAVGDSITRGFDACGLLSDCPRVSWATGTDDGVRSLAVRLLGEPGVAGHAWNYARSGASVAELPAQMAKVAPHRPELVTVMMGANDACKDKVGLMTPVDEFRASFEESMRRLRADAPKTHVYVASVPDLKRLWSEGRENPVGRQIWKLGICSTMLGDAQDMGPAAQQRRSTVQARVVAYNTVLKDVCAKDLRCRYDGGAVFDFRFTGDQLSRWDWFHPSKDGQGRLADLAYRNIVAVKPPV
ncbi:SGNH/GDSL hydrolase family protein [Streptomyces sp. NBC_01498]|uniref:SGNH/GDSL hydrolase family protein n=1 Tax=Streptomyces sp. NBC_01498 TaxID=2975870 RepID=UPI002E7B9DBA|nr:SGNH/GDSL hydrolase family protein [Streptomyces sp. NBC_01498]WTL27078.1 SGNH/GDSL hydrolase family protein [Streptomyces sp. NBC_01498]